MFRDIKEHVLAMANSAHVHPVLLIDEAHLARDNQDES